jgi:dUTP pyrophosphatase
MTTILKVKKLFSDSKIPFYAHEGDAGMDLYSREEKNIAPGETSLIKTGISIELPHLTEAQIRPRSGLALKNSITVLNSPGTIDEGYRGEIGVILINHGKENFYVEKHMRIAQMVIKPIIRVDIQEVNSELSKSERAEGGFGSSGLK